MKVKLQHDWFAPTDTQRVGSGAIVLRSAGRMYRGAGGPEQGVHDMPEELREFLPKSATIVGEEVVDAPVKRKRPDLTLKDFDFDRAAGEAEDKALSK
jgi:hypothetical protein